MNKELQLKKLKAYANSLTGAIPKLADTKEVCNKSIVAQRDGDVLLTGIIIPDDAWPFEEDIVGYITPAMLRRRVEAQDGAVRLLINSEGGDFFAGIEMSSFLQLEQEAGRDITCVNMGIVASAATLPYLSVPVEKRQAMENTFFLFHEAFAFMCGVVNSAYALSLHNDLVSMNAQLVESFVKATSATQEQAEELFKADRIITLKEASELGVYSPDTTESNGEQSSSTAAQSQFEAIAAGQRQYLQMLDIQ